MTEILLGILILLALVNLLFVLRNRKSADPGPQLKEVETSILKFQTVLEKSERTAKDEFERNRRESLESAKAGREELSKALLSFVHKGDTGDHRKATGEHPGRQCQAAERDAKNRR